MAGYYDYVLGFIPFALFGVSFALYVTGLSLTTAVPVGAGVALIAIGHAMFVNGPVDDLPTETPAETPTAAPANAD